jgi:hypothetical protein
MESVTRAQEPFHFYTRLHLTELTGLRASTLSQLLKLIKEVPGSCIYHHTHRFLQQHQYLSPEPPNDFAYWVSSILGEDELGEDLASIDTIMYSRISDLRAQIIKTIEEYLKKNSMAHMRFAKAGEEFHFIKTISFILPTAYLAYDLKEFIDVLEKVTIDSIYFHIFESRLRLEKKTNDFSYWLETSLGQVQLAEEIARLDPYTRTLDDLRNTLIAIMERYVKG